MTKPDYSVTHTRHGGYLKDIPLPHIRMFPNKAGHKRTVCLDVYSWLGIGLEAKHYYVRSRQEDNYIWNSHDALWQLAWGDNTGKGFEQEWTTETLGNAISRLRQEAATYDLTVYTLSFGCGVDTLQDYIQDLYRTYGVVDHNKFRVGD
jgi:hypothetical protein